MRLNRRLRYRTRYFVNHLHKAIVETQRIQTPLFIIEITSLLMPSGRENKTFLIVDDQVQISRISF